MLFNRKVEFKLIASSQKFEKYQEFNLKKSSQTLKIKFEVCFDIKSSFLIKFKI